MENDGKKTILIVDDTKPIRILLLKRLEKHYDCLLSSEPYEALKLFDKYSDKIDLIISDYEMPKLNGYQFLKRIEARKKTVPVIMVSGTLDKSRIQKLISLGVRKFMAKPVNINRLTHEINSILE